MSWYDETWSFRAPIAVNNTGGGTPIDASVTIPSTWDEFWGTVLSTGFDVRLVAADGVTMLTFKRTTWDYANKSAIFEISAWAPGSSDATCQAFLYWGRVAPVDEATSPVITSPKLGTIELGFPVGTVVDARREAPGTTSPSQVIHKTANETIFVYIALDGVLARRSTRGNGSFLYEELQWVQVKVTDAAADQPGMYDETKTRIIEHRRRRYLRGQIAAGTAGENYTLETTIRTSLGQQHELRHLIKVRTPAD